MSGGITAAGINFEIAYFSEPTMTDSDNQPGAGAPAAPHYDPTDASGNSKERAKPAISNVPGTELDPERKKRAEEVLENFEGEAVRPQPDDF